MISNQEAILAVTLHIPERLGFLDVHNLVHVTTMHMAMLLLEAQLLVPSVSRFILMLLIEAKEGMLTAKVLINMEIRRKVEPSWTEQSMTTRITTTMEKEHAREPRIHALGQVQMLP